MLRKYASIVFALVITLTFASASFSAEVNRMTKDELKSLMEQGSPVVVLDVRSGSDWKGSEFKIKGSVRVTDLDEFAKSNSKDAQVVLYCA